MPLPTVAAGARAAPAQCVRRAVARAQGGAPDVPTAHGVRRSSSSRCCRRSSSSALLLTSSRTRDRAGDVGRHRRASSQAGGGGRRRESPSRAALQEPAEPSGRGAGAACRSRRRRSAGCAPPAAAAPSSRGAAASAAAARGGARDRGERAAGADLVLDRARASASRCIAARLLAADLGAARGLQDAADSFFPLAMLILAVLGSIVFGLATPTEAAAVGAFGGFLLAAVYRFIDHWREASAEPGSRGGRRPTTLSELGAILKESSFLTAKTSAMVCWLFVGSCDLLGGVRAARRPGAHREVGAVAGPDAAAVHDPGAGHHLHPRLAAGVDRDHRDLHADLHSAAAALRHRSAVLRPAGGAQPADRVPVAAGGDGGVLPEGRVAAARDAEPDLRAA